MGDGVLTGALFHCSVVDRGRLKLVYGDDSAALPIH